MSKIDLSIIKGYKEEKEEVVKIINLLNHYDEYTKQGVSIPRGLIFQGPPGTGKTLFAKAIAGECKYKFYNAVSDEFDENPLNTLKKTFKEAEAEVAKTNKPCLIYIDEIDKLVYTDSKSGDLKDKEAREACRFLLQKLDSAHLKNKILIIVSTNDYGSIPHALLRSGRFDKKLIIGFPDTKSRKEILTLYINNHPLFDDIDIGKLALNTNGMSGADLKTLINNTLLEYVTVKNKICLDDFIKIINEMNFETIGKKWEDKQANLTILVHEVGHLLVSGKLTGKWGTISALSYGGIGGVTTFQEDEDPEGKQVEIEVEECPMDMAETRGTIAFDDLLDKACICCGGKIAEKLFLGIETLGPSQDLSQLDRNISVLWDCGYFNLEAIKNMFNTEKVKDKANRLQRALVSKLYKKATKIIKQNRCLGLYLIEEIHNNNDILSQEQIEEKVAYFEANKEKMIEKYKKINAKDLF